MREAFVFAIAPASRGFGYVVFAGRTKPMDWGVKEIRSHKNSKAPTKIEEMVRRIAPATLLIENPMHKSCRGSLRAKLFLKDAIVLAEAQRVPAVGYAR